ncbi:MAG: choice-of-anchor D domain-containing protein, partial [bacterium]
LTMAQGARGAVLALTPGPGTTIAFGDVAAGTPASRSYSVKNTGNVGAAVSVAVTGSGFSATTPGAGTVPAGGADTAATVTQTVAQRGSLTGTLAVSTTTALCQPAAPGALNLTAPGRAAVASIGSAPAMVALCGAGTPASVNIAVANNGDVPLVISSATATGGFVVTSSIPLTVPAGASRNLGVRPPAATVGTDPAGTVKTGTLSLATNEIGNPTRNVSLSSTVTGAVLAVTPAPGSTIAFGNVNAGTPASQTYSVRNTGNLNATVTVATTGAGFSATRPNGGTIPANGTNQSATVTQTVAQHGAVTGTLTVSSTTAQCAAAPGAVNLTAFGRTPTAAIGTVPSMTAACGAGTPAIVTVSIRNTGDAPLVLNASASGGFVITSAASMTIAAGATSAITLRPPTAVVGSDLGGTTKTGMLTITTNEVTGATHQIPLASTVVGANLSLRNAAGAPITTATFNANMECPASQAIFITNTGNADAQVSITTPNFQLFRFDDFIPSSSVPAGTSVFYMMRVWTVFSACAGNAPIQYSATGTLCTALPLTLQASFNISGQTSCFCT